MVEYTMDVILVPDNCTKLHEIKLPDPKDGSLKQLFYDEENLHVYEVTKYFDPHRSWFLDNKLCKEGHFNILTRVDPLYLFIPQLIKFANEHFRTLEDICITFASNSTDGCSKIDFALSPNINWDLICDTKVIDDELFIRFNQGKTLDWLVLKHEKTVLALKGNLEGEPSRATYNSYAYDLINVYLPPSLSVKFKDFVRNKPLENSEENPKGGRKRPSEDQAQRYKQQDTPTKGSILMFFKKKV